MKEYRTSLLSSYVLDYLITDNALPSFVCASLRFMFTTHILGAIRCSMNEHVFGKKLIVARSSLTILFLMTFPIYCDNNFPSGPWFLFDFSLCMPSA